MFQPLLKWMAAEPTVEGGSDTLTSKPQDVEHAPVPAQVPGLRF
jgi:hypothetical protein